MKKIKQYKFKLNRTEDSYIFLKNQKHWNGSYFDNLKFLYEIINDGAVMGIDDYRIYSSSIYDFFTKNEIEVESMTYGKKLKINPRKMYYKIFGHSYKKGQQFFMDNWYPSSLFLYSGNLEKWLKDFYNMFYKSDWRKAYNERYIFNSVMISEIGYYSGIMNEADNLIKDRPSIFQDEILKKSSEIKSYDNYVIGSNISSIQSLLSQYFPEVIVNISDLLEAFLKEGSRKVIIDFSNKYETKIAGNFLIELKGYYSSITKKKFTEDIAKRIYFISSGTENPSAKTLSNWMVL